VSGEKTKETGFQCLARRRGGRHRESAGKFDFLLPRKEKKKAKILHLKGCCCSSVGRAKKKGGGPRVIRELRMSPRTCGQKKRKLCPQDDEILLLRRTNPKEKGRKRQRTSSWEGPRTYPTYRGGNIFQSPKRSSSLGRKRVRKRGEKEKWFVTRKVTIYVISIH